MSDKDWHLTKRTTGIDGLDQMTLGGLPKSQVTLILGHSGAGKSILCLQVLANAVASGKGAVFLSLEESRGQILRNADSFDWGETLTGSDQWTIIDARITPKVDFAGEFDLEALLAAASAAASAYDDPWIVLDGIDQLLKQHPNPETAVDQVRQINDFCEQSGHSVLLTGKIDHRQLSPYHLDSATFMLPAVIILTSRLVDNRLSRHLRIAKYRGTGHRTNDTPMVIDDQGISLPAQVTSSEPSSEASTHRLSSGNRKLDAVLGGGPYKGSSLLLSGRPGTAKSTIAATFASAAAERGERVLFISFDEVEESFVRNLRSVGVELKAHIDSGRLHFRGFSADSHVAIEHILNIQRLVDELTPDLLIIDPISALLKTRGAEDENTIAERVIKIGREHQTTVLLTSLSDDDDPEGEATLVHASTLADSWVVLDYNVRRGERNRSLSVVKSRGTAHSNQQRELKLSSEGIDILDVYEYGDEVLMGTARAQRRLEDETRAWQLKLEREARRNELKSRMEAAEMEKNRAALELEMQEQKDEEHDRLYGAMADQVRRSRDPEFDPEGDAS